MTILKKGVSCVRIAGENKSMSAEADLVVDLPLDYVEENAAQRLDWGERAVHVFFIAEGRHISVLVLVVSDSGTKFARAMNDEEFRRFVESTEHQERLMQILPSATLGKTARHAEPYEVQLWLRSVVIIPLGERFGADGYIYAVSAEGVVGRKPLTVPETTHFVPSNEPVPESVQVYLNRRRRIW